MTRKYRYDIEYTLDNEDNDCDFVEGIFSLKEAKSEAKKLKAKYGDRIVKLDIKKFDLETDYLEEHIVII